MIQVVSTTKLQISSTLIYILVLLLSLSACSLGSTDAEMLEAAKASLSNGEYSKAIIELKTILQDNAGNNDARQLLADSYIKIGDGSSAEKEINQISMSTALTSELQQLLLASWDMQGKHRAIIEEYEKGKFKDVERNYVWGVVSSSFVSEQMIENGEALARKLLALDPKSVRALRVLAKASSLKDNEDLALDFLNKALAIDAANYNVWYDIGLVNAKQQNHLKAIDALKKAISLLPESEPARQKFVIKVALVQVLLHMGNLDEGGHYLKQLKAKHNKNHYISYLSGLHKYLLKQYDAAIGELSEVHTNLPGHLPTMLLLGALHYSDNNLEQANLLLTRYVYQVPTHLQARKLLGEIKLRLDKPKEALSLLQSTHDQNRDAEILTMIGLAASQSGNYSQGVEYLRRAAESNPEDTRIREELAQLYLSHGAIDEAINELEKDGSGSSDRGNNLLALSYIRKQDYKSARRISDQVLSNENGRVANNYYLRAMIELATGNRSNARKYLSDALTVNAEYIPALLAFARIDLEDGRLIAADERLNLVLTRDPQNVNAMLLLAQISERSGNKEEALLWMERSIKSNQNTLLPRAIMARHYLRKKQPKKAATYLDDKAFRDSDNALILLLVAVINQQNGNHKEAESAFNKIIRLNPRNEGAYLQLAKLQSEAGNLVAAKSTLIELDNHVPMSSKGMVLRYKIEMKEGHYKAANNIANQLLANDKTRFTGISLLANYNDLVGDHQTAIKLLKQNINNRTPFFLVQQLSSLYNKHSESNRANKLLVEWIRDHQDDLQAKMTLAINYQSQSRMSEAIKLYEDVLSENPDNVVALNNAALLNFENNPEKALGQAKKAYKSGGNTSLAVTDTYAWLIHRSGDTDTAIELLKPILGKTKDSSIHYHYAVMLSEVDRESEARDVLLGIISTNQDFPESEQARQLLSEISTGNG
ncbi:MAG: PEP-CTERM system TPR-repeat protein PrsT [Candidatus Thiodiazotropha sp. (ex Codakia rugifera)]|nr:PEP-CTERM system TPR-repeat protein PrsT [Candidatus Thiodiazotropha sp. (ex Codakia rugifera)]